MDPVVLPGDSGQIEVPSGNGQKDIFIGRYTTAGEPSWGYILGGPEDDFAEGVAVDRRGDIYFSGLFGSTFDIDPGPEVVMIAPVDWPTNHYIAKFDSAGTFLHVLTLVTHGDMEGLCMGFDAENNLILGGTNRGPLDLDGGPGEVIVPGPLTHWSGFVAKYDPNGVLLDHTVISGHSWVDVMDIVVKPDGSFVVAGSFEDELYIGPTPETWLNGAPRSNFYAAYDPSFQLSWAINIGAALEPQTQHICEAVGGGHIVCGHFFGEFNATYVDGTTETFSAPHPGHLFLARIGSAGGLSWFKQLPISSTPIQVINGLVAHGDGTFSAELSYVDMELEMGTPDAELVTPGFPIYNMGFARYDMETGELRSFHGFEENAGYNILELCDAPTGPYMLGTYQSGSINVAVDEAPYVLTGGTSVLVRYCDAPTDIKMEADRTARSLLNDTIYTCEATVIALSGAGSFNWYLSPNDMEPFFQGSSFKAPAPSVSVTYFIVGLNGTCASDPSTITIAPCAHVDVSSNEGSNGLHVFPVPARSVLQVDPRDLAGELWRIDLVDILGRTVVTVEPTDSGPVMIAVDHLGTGRYNMVAHFRSGRRVLHAVLISP